MFSWIWGCMVLSLKIAVGGFFWIIAIFGIGVLIQLGLEFGDKIRYKI